ncbi:D(2) dopamine receptor A-like [Lytechinus variegatus]|uniref:D(2) dopamine receptor A-like n=1 Tax=Lytechinus variegatus TaxID=7654 RepID=UPI001BB2BF7F|nr:D(2) dopamine receptor A-like [Lytechinus variegatus]
MTSRLFHNHGNQTHYEEENDALSQQNKWLLLCESISLGVIIITSLVANMVAIGTIMRLRSLRNVPHHLLVLNLSIADLGITLTSMPFALYSIFDGGVLLRSNAILCKVNGFFATMFTLANFPTVLAIAIDRFLIVVYSSRFPPNTFRIFLMITISWCSAFIMAFMPSVHVLSKYSYSPNTWHCSPRWGHNIFRIACAILIFGLAIPMVAVCYAAIVYFIWNKQQLLRSYSKREQQVFKDRRRKSRDQKPSVPRCYKSTVTSFQPSPSPASCDEVGELCSLEQQSGCQPDDLQDAQMKYNQENKTIPYLTKLQNPTCEEDFKEEALNTEAPLEPRNIDKLDKRSFRSVAVVAESAKTSAIVNKSLTQFTALSEPSGEESDVVGQDRDRKKQHEARQRQFSADKRVAVMGALLVLTTLICWMPYLLVHSNYIRVNEGHWFGVFTMLLGYTNAIWDPLIYTFINKQARKECKKYFRFIATSSRSLRGSVVKQN